nr:prepilin-type N-terminal cleavage/methylation domain-containing protein [Microbacterium bovistercoris]
MIITTEENDAGITLVELIVSVVVGAIIAGLMAGLFINGLKSQAQTTDRDTATGTATVIANSLQTSIRNAVSVTPSTGSGRTLVALVATGASGWECRAWSLTPDGLLMYKSANAKFSTTSTTGWTRIASGVRGSLTGGAIFTSVSATQVKYAFTLSAGTAGVPVSGGVVAQAVIEGAGPCW